jgi:hypothetical protein
MIDPACFQAVRFQAKPASHVMRGGYRFAKKTRQGKKKSLVAIQS